jgi:diadenosine tetraphosphatase ApaH/serine/threonine PP2A family protein phosphatase
MRALVLSDIHGNLEALEAVLAAAPPHDVVWNLGDIVGYGANPNEVIDRVRPLGNLVVRGNHDRACGGLAVFDFSQNARVAVLWTESILEDEHREWLRNLPTGPVTPEDSEVSCVHGSPRDEDEYLFTLDDASPSLQAASSPITLFGHTHRQVGFATGDYTETRLQPEYNLTSEAEQFPLKLRSGYRYLLNPGSVGQPRDADWRAAFAIFDSEQSVFTWHRVPYDVAETQRRIQSAGLPNALAYRLERGF